MGNHLTISNYSKINVGNYGIINNSNANSSATISVNPSGKAFDSIIDGGYLYIDSNAAAYNTTINSGRLQLYVGTAYDSILNGDSVLELSYSGDQATDISGRTVINDEVTIIFDYWSQNAKRIAINNDGELVF